MKKSIFKGALVCAMFGAFTFMFNMSADAQADPANKCPDGTLRCAKEDNGPNVWHKGNTAPTNPTPAPKGFDTSFS